MASQPHPDWGTWVWGSGFWDRSGWGSSPCANIYWGWHVPDAVWPWDTKNKEKSLSFKMPMISGVQVGRSRSRVSRAAHLPLPGDEIDVVSQRWVVSGQVLRRSVVARVVRLGECRSCAAPKLQAGTGAGVSLDNPVACYPASADTEGAVKGARNSRGRTLRTFLLWPQRPSLLRPTHPNLQSVLRASHAEGAESGETILWIQVKICSGPSAPPENSEQQSSSRVKNPARDAELGRLRRQFKTL